MQQWFIQHISARLGDVPESDRGPGGTAGAGRCHRMTLVTGWMRQYAPGQATGATEYGRRAPRRRRTGPGLGGRMRRGRGVRFSAGAIGLGMLLGACSAERTSVQPVDPPLGEASGAGPSGGPASGGPAVADELFGPAAWVADVAAGGEVLVWNGHVLVLKQDVLTALDAAGSTVWVAETGVNDEALGPAELDEAFLRVLGPDAVAVVRQTPSPNGEWSVSTVTMADGSVTGPTPVTGYPDVGDIGVVFGATMDSPVPRPVDTAWLRPDASSRSSGSSRSRSTG